MVSSRPLGIYLALFSLVSVHAATEKYRLTWRTDPTTTMVVAWCQTSGSDATVYYDTVDHGTNLNAYAFKRGVDHTTTHKRMTHQFSRLSGLEPNRVYYFVIADSDSVSPRFSFRTAPADDTPFTVIAGGDSRNNTNVRIRANKMVAKLRPLFVMFGGDMTDNNTSREWRGWLDHWQYTIASDGRMTPIVAARGNHEGSNLDLVNIFDSPHPQIYFALTFGADLLRTYTLNSEDVEGGNQGNWLADDLARHQHVTWRFAQYHKPMRPHVRSKSEGDNEYNAWARIFDDHNVQLVVECDSHMVKSTWPIRPDAGPDSDEGFVRDDENGTVYLGEGTWGAPLRRANDAKTWTRAIGSFNQFKWMHVSRDQISIKTVRYDNVDSVTSLSDTDPWVEPAGIDIWNPPSGREIVLRN